MQNPRHVIARFSKYGQSFEVLVDSEKIREYKEGKSDNLQDAVISTSVFKKITFAKKTDSGQLMQESSATSDRVDDDMLVKVFGTSGFLDVCRKIIDQGGIQYTQEQRREFLDMKFRQIASIISSQAIDPTRNVPHPRERIESVMAEARVKVDMHRSAESQVKDVLKEISKLVPISMEVKIIEIIVPIHYGNAVKKIISDMSMLKKEQWSATSYMATVSIGAGLVDNFFAKINNITHGDTTSKILD